MNPADWYNLPLFQSPWFIPLLIWSLIWKGLALYRAGNLRDKWWFIVILVVNTFGILDIVYYFVFSQRNRGKPPADISSKE